MNTKLFTRRRVAFVLFLTLLLQASTVAAYEPIYTNGKKWISEVEDPRMGYLLWHDYTEVIGDTVIGGETVKILEHLRVPNGKYACAEMMTFGWPKASRTHYYRLENAGKVYDVKTDGTKALVMDFDSPVGTSWEYTITDHFDGEQRRIFTIVNCDTITQTRRNLRRLTIEIKTTPYAMVASVGEDEEQWIKDYYVWIEGVGTLCNYAELGSKHLDTTEKSALECCIFPSDYFGIFEAGNVKPVMPPAAIESVRSDEKQPDGGRIYDLQGRAVTHPQKGAIYISGGRKVVWSD